MSLQKSINLIGYNIADKTTFAGRMEMPVLIGTDRAPETVVDFEDCALLDAEKTWVNLKGFSLNALMGHQKSVLDALRQSAGAISPRPSLLPEMDDSEAIGLIGSERYVDRFWECHGVIVIPRVTLIDGRLVPYSIDGLPCGTSVVVCNVGNCQSDLVASRLHASFSVIIRELHPKTGTRQIIWSTLGTGLGLSEFRRTKTAKRCLDS